MAVFDHWAYIFALLLYAPIRVEAAVVVPPPEVMAAQHLGYAPVVVAKPLPQHQCGWLIIRTIDRGCSTSSQQPRSTTTPDPRPAGPRLHGGR